MKNLLNILKDIYYAIGIAILIVAMAALILAGIILVVGTGRMTMTEYMTYIGAAFERSDQVADEILKDEGIEIKEPII